MSPNFRWVAGRQSTVVLFGREARHGKGLSPSPAKGAWAAMSVGVLLGTIACSDGATDRGSSMVGGGTGATGATTGSGATAGQGATTGSGGGTATGGTVIIGGGATGGTAPGTGGSTGPSFDGTLTGIIRDFTEDHPDMEMFGKHGVDDLYMLEEGIVETTIGADRKPVYAGDPVNGTLMTTGKEAFDQWYRDVPGVNMSQEFTIQLADPDLDGVYTYDNNGMEFFPIDDLLLGNGVDPHNFHFTFELHTSFTYQGGEVFSFKGDDDVWVFINDQLVVDIGGVHASIERSVSADDLGLTLGETYPLDFFWAERHVYGSNFRIDTSLRLSTVILK